MNDGIVRNALTTTLALELEYREPSMVRESEPNQSDSQDVSLQDDCLKIELAYLLSMI
jgi:hypothetical protein